MPPSQLKQLKASLRDSGILAPQKSKKQRKSTARDAAKRLQRNAAIENIRQRFNPFEAKAPSRAQKFEIASNKPAKPTIERPGVTRGLGEERRRATLLKEIQSRNKVGGMHDRRFGEDDPNMTPEMKAAERFARQATRQSRKSGMFDLEDDNEEDILLTHGGKALDLDETGDRLRDDFDDDVPATDEEDFHPLDDRPRKRLRLDDTGAAESENEEHQEVPQRKKTKNEVMQEVIAKSKAYKAARQAQKEDDDDLRAELDKGIGDMFAALTHHRPKTKQLPSPPGTDSEPVMDPSRAAMLAGKSREDAEKEYEANIRQLKLEARSKPTTRTKTEEEKAAEEKARLEDLERKRLRRMKGEAESSDDDSEGHGIEIDQDQDDAEAFGLDQPRYMPQLAVEDEDQFVMDNILASDSDAELASDFEDDDSTTLQEPEDDGDDDFINGLVLPQPAPSTPVRQIRASSPTPKPLPFTFGCPQDVTELMNETKDVSPDDLPTAVQRIRALYHKGLAPGNDEKLAKFAHALIFWISALVNGLGDQDPSMEVIEQLLRHVHSMAKTQPNAVAAGFRDYLRRFLSDERKSLNQGDLVILTGISTIFPTSDQWHPVVTPAMLVLARHLGQAPMESLADLVKGAYACSLALRYQMKSERYVPEAVTFICKGIDLLAPKYHSSASLNQIPGTQSTSLNITSKASNPPASKLSFYDLCMATFSQHEATTDNNNTPSSTSSFTVEKPQPTITAESVLLNLLNLCISLIDYYSATSAFPELIKPLTTLITTRLSHPTTLSLLHPETQTAITALSTTLNLATSISLTNRKPLLLHSHRPLAIKSAHPLFSETYNPERKQRDPDAERAELNKLKAEHKKERKGAMRELRKDANFMAREQLREKKARDEAYDKKFKRLVAEIQGEEGREAKVYEREKARRKGGRF